MSARQFFFEFCYESSYRDALWDLINSNSNIINFFLNMQIFCFKNLFFGKYLFKRELYINNGTLRKFCIKMINRVAIFGNGHYAHDQVYFYDSNYEKYANCHLQKIKDTLKTNFSI